MHVFIDAVSIRGGGGARVLTTMVDGLCQLFEDWRWTLFVNDVEQLDFGLPRHPNLTISHQGKGSWLGRFDWLGRRLPALIDKSDCDVLLSLANLSPLRSKRPVVLFLQQMKLLDDRDVRTLRTRLLRWYFRRTISVPSRLVVQTEVMRGLLLRAFPKCQQRVAVIPSAVIIDSEAEDGGSIAGTLRQYGKPRLCYVSNASDHKNHIHLVRGFAASQAAARGAVLFLTIAPPMTTGASSREAVVHEEMKRLGIEKQVIYLGEIAPAAVTALHQASDLMIFPSLLESFGLPLVEAMMVGCPVAAADLPYAHEILGEAGVYFDPRNDQSIATTIDCVLDDPALLAAMRQSGLARSSLFDLKHLTESFGSLLATVVASRERIR